jgi:hypothetical protein
LRSRQDSIAKLETLFTHAKAIGGKTRFKDAKTAFGMKDMYQNHFTEKIFNFAKDLRGPVSSRQAKLDEMVAKLPKNLTSPVWRIQKGLAVLIVSQACTTTR